MVTLAELKEQNAQEDESKLETDVKPADEDVTDEVTDDEVDETTDNEDEDEPKVVEDWQKSDKDKPDDDNQVPVGKLMSVKKKLRGTIDEQGEEIARLKAELEKSKQPIPATIPELPTRPVETNFDTTELYNAALDKYETDKIIAINNQAQRDNSILENQKQAQQTFEAAVDEHYNRVETLLKDTGIKEDAYIEAHNIVRDGLESIMPKQGETVLKQLITMIDGEGSEKIIFNLGRNKNVRNELFSLINKDKSGLKVAVFLGQLKQKLTKPIKQTSKAPAPASKANGDGGIKNDTATARKLKKIYDDAHKKGGGQAAFNAKRDAKKAGVNVSNW